MATDLPGEIRVFDRDELARQYLRAYQLRSPSADVGPGTQPEVDAKCLADQLAVLHQSARVIGLSTNLDTSRGTRLEQWGEVDGIERPEASPAVGFVDITTATGGATIQDGDELRNTKTGQRFRCTATALYTADKPPPIASVDTGPATNLEAGTVLQWTNPRPGCAKNCTVRADSDGNGLTGGRDAATDEEWIALLKDARRNPPAGANDAAIRKAVRDTPGLQVEAVFTYPAIYGPGMTAVAFTVKPTTTGGNRIPTTAQSAYVKANLLAQLPHDDGIFMLTILEQSTEVALEIDWRSGAASWADITPWPVWIPGDPIRVVSGATPTATTFRVGTATNTTTPQAGQTIGVYDADAGVFRRKRIESVTVITPNQKWDIVVDTSEAVSDTDFTPVIGDLVSPWSDSLDSVAEPVIAAFAKLGTGELFATLPDPEYRQRREPVSPAEWPSVLTNKTLLGSGELDPVTGIRSGVFGLPQVQDASILLPASIPHGTTVGTPGVSVYLQHLGGLAAYPEQ
jgi:uncharacterized phage protein gp47/JayE